MKRGIVMVVALLATPAFADVIHLKGGGKITGQIVKRTEDAVTVDIGGGTLTARTSSIVSIEESESPLQLYRRKAAEIPPGDAEAWRKLARVATGLVLSNQVAEAWQHVLAILPDDPEANQALGRVLLDGRWVTEEESYRARGYIQFEGDWMTPAEQQAILQDRRAQEDAARQAMAAQAQAEDQAHREREAKKQAEHDEFWQDNLSHLGDPVLVNWGPGPTSWPAPAGGLQ